MGALLNLTPWYYRWLAIAALVAAVMGFGYVRGFLREEHRFAAYQAQVDAVGKAAAERAAKTKAAQDQNTKEIHDGWDNDVAAIHAYYSAHPVVVVRKRACGSPVPAAPDSASRPDGPAVESGAAGAAEDQDSDGMSQDFIMACAMDAARVNRWREFAIKNHFPVE